MPERPTSNRPAVEHPIRRANRDQNLIGRSNQTSEYPLLPTLNDGITLLDFEGDLGVPVLQALVLDHLLLHDGPVFWVDANGHATTTTFARIAPSQRLLNRVHVARGFTAYQHYGAICDLPAAVNEFIQRSTFESDARLDSDDHVEESSTPTPSLIVVPAVDVQYRDEDTLREDGAEMLQSRTLARLSAYSNGYDVPVLLTRSQADEFTAPVATVADHRLECVQTQMGPRFVGDEFETLLYPVDGGMYYQTTFTYWQQLLEMRVEQMGMTLETPAPPTNGGTHIGTGMTTNGGPQPLAANPLLDAWTNAEAGGR